MNLMRYARFLRAEYGIDATSADADDDGDWYRRPGLLKGKIIMRDDFDAPLDDFEDYM